MDQNLKVSIFNPSDKQKDKTRYYLGYVPKDMKTIVRKNNCKYDTEIFRWFTTDENSKMIQDFSKTQIDFWELMNELGVSYDKDDKIWYTYKSNEKIQSKYFL